MNDVLNQVIDDYKCLYHTEKEKRKDLQTRWDSLREWLEEQIENTIGYSERICFTDTIDKMNELEGGNNENN